MTCHRLLLPLIWTWTVYASLVDLRTQRVPSGWPRRAVYAATALCAVPVQIARFRPDALFPYALLFALVLGGWFLGAVGGGDVKLWAVWWLWTPPDLAWTGAMVTGLLWAAGGLFQVLVLRLPRGQKHPAAWKAALYGLWLIIMLWKIP